MKTISGWKRLQPWGSLVEFASLKEYDPVRKEGRATRQTQSAVKPERGSCGIQGSSWTLASPQDSGSLLSCVRRGNGPRRGPRVLQGVRTGCHSPGPISRPNCSKHRGGKGPVSYVSTWGGPVGLGFFCLEPRLGSLAFL